MVGSKFFSIEKVNGISQMHVTGPINEVSGAALMDAIREIEGKCVINLKDVSYINSIGVRCWISFINTLQVSCAITLSECSVDFTMQLNMINSFAGKSTVESICAQYICADCNYEDIVLFKVADLRHMEPSSLQYCKCKECGKDAELAEDPEIFLRFLGKVSS